MIKKLLKISIPIGIFAGGVFLGKHFQKQSEKKIKVYSGVLNLEKSNEGVDLYLTLNVAPESLESLTDVTFKINKVIA